ncbi:hypothetical protein [Micromonospora sp. b486]|uniref:hypothetical protein n=1 Tax=Micromonospora sp. b486 TaxID=3053986 RepID=UPI00259CB388|nr:hypothetical protein [Micromonospora sp. b486]MDM4778002.1 hypothetical protein [Micromonospora sp. b486]
MSSRDDVFCSRGGTTDDHHLSIGRRVAVGLAGAALALTTAAPAVAAPTAAEAAADISVGRLVLEPTARGYQGKLPVTVTNNGPTATYFFVDVLEPVAASFRALDPEEACGFPAAEGQPADRELRGARR